MARKRSFTTFSLSFLDIMSCGFGAVVLVFLLLDHAIEAEALVLNADLLSEASLLEEEVTTGEEGLVKLRNTLSQINFDVVEARGLASRIAGQINSLRALIEALEQEGPARRSEIAARRAQLAQLEARLKKLRAASDSAGGDKARAHVGEGNRQYLTGLRLGGRNIVILVDASASMLAAELVNVIRIRNMDDDKLKRRTRKWQRAVGSVGWLTAQLPRGSYYQLYTFNETTTAVLSGSRGQWLKTDDQKQLNAAVAALRQVVPTGGTNLEGAVLALLDMSPLPDNVFLITDGLPTRGSAAPRRNKVTGPERGRLFRQAVRQLPRSVSVNTILLPMEGDTLAAAAYWQLAQATDGSFMSPAEDWP